MAIDIKLSPMMAQWHACKTNALDALLLFRLGDFYEAFYEDASVIARELDLTLTKRQDIPMAGVPFHASESYIDKLVAKGYRVAIAEQMEDPRAVKGLVKREIVRVITPGTVICSSLLSEKRNNFLACATQVGGCFGLGILDVTTAELRVIECEEIKQVLDELCRLSPKEILLPESWQDQHATCIREMKEYFNPALRFRQTWHFSHEHACSVLLRHFQVRSLDGFGLKGMIAAINAAGALLHYVKDDLSLSIDHIKEIKLEHLSHYMLLDRATQRHLELFDSASEKKGCTLLGLLDQTATPMGGRLLRQWLLHPLLDVEEITLRQEGVQECFDRWSSSEELVSHLREIRDLERLVMRIETGNASPRDMAGLCLSLEHIAPLVQVLASAASEWMKRAVRDCSELWESKQGEGETPSHLSALVSRMKSALVDAPPLRLSDGGVFKRGYHPLLDELYALKEDSHAWMARYQTQLREATRIKTLKVGFTKAFGFYIEVSRGQSDRIPESFQRRQTLVNAERFITSELKEYEHKILHAEERALGLEYELFAELRAQVASCAPAVRKMAQAVAKIDCVLALAVVARSHRYVRPVVDTSDVFLVEEGRHPVIEAALEAESFIPNDLFMQSASSRLILITGPNMAGKSTFIRQAALIAILAQMGSFVPAKRVHMGMIDRVFSRIGASDHLSQGQSTFMVEMIETANILNNATDRSLVILDEIGRGTSTYDGISIAWAVAEYLLTCPGKKAKTLFATHYWELTELEKHISGAVNCNVAVHESDQGIVFLRKIVKGGTDKSYGIHVAKLAGIPEPVIKRAEEMLIKLEQSRNQVPTKPKPVKDLQLSLFNALKEDPRLARIKQDIQLLDIDDTTPIQALKHILRWKEMLQDV